MAESRIGILCTSWWGLANSDSQLEHLKGFTDSLVTKMLDTAARYKVKVCVHLEPYKGRSAISVEKDLKYLIESYGNHPALYRDPERGNRPIVFVYDSYQTKAQEWATILKEDGPSSIRGKAHDAIMIALYVDNKVRIF